MMLTYFGRLWGLIPEEEAFEENCSISMLGEDNKFEPHEACCTLAESGRNIDDIEIEGDDNFCFYVRNCLSEVVRHGTFESMVSNLTKIKQVENWSEVGMRTDGVFLANSMVFDGCENDFIWGASQIIHDAKHYERMLEGKFDHANYVGEELIAFVPQARFLRDSGRHSQAAYIENSDGRHVFDRVDA